jgi:hypothetical protein
MLDPTVSPDRPGFVASGSPLPVTALQAHNAAQSALSPGQILDTIGSWIAGKSAGSIDDIPIQVPGLENPIYISKDDYSIISEGQGKNVSFTVNMPYVAGQDKDGNDVIKTRQYSLPELPPIKSE